jgi:serine/threonine-protein kinase
MVCPRCHGTYQGSKVFCPVDGARLADRLDIDAMETTPFAPAERLIDRRYEVGELIGHGTMARVYGATDLVTGKPVAVKILNRRYSQIERERKRFLREARAALAIDHPSVVKVLDVGKTPDNRPFLAIEHLQGESLGECLRRRGTLPIELALKLVLQAAVGLGAVHRAGIVHRDVKPDNIYLLGPRDAPTGVKLFDFGLARLHHDDTSESGDIVGTAAYMAPEQVLAENVDARGDVYSLGVVLFRAITGHLPFEGPNDLELIAQQVLLPAPPPSWFLEGLDPRIDAVVVRAMSKRPEHRFPSMEPMAAALQAIEQGDAEQPPAAAQPADDVYEPVTDNGRSAIGMLRRALGMQPER